TPHVVQHVLLLVSAFLWWRSVAGVDPDVGEPSRIRSVVLTAAVVSVTAVLGLLLLEARDPLYRIYAAAPRPWGGEEAFDLQRAAGWVQLLAGVAVALAACAGVRRLRSSARWAGEL